MLSINKKNKDIDLWGGVECTINRIGNTYMDQLKLSGYYTRKGDLNEFAKLGITALRYPILWETYQPHKYTKVDFGELATDLFKLKQNNIEPIAGLLHHGSGPEFTDLLDENFPLLFAEYAAEVASAFPYLKYYTPVNEPLTTARFSGLYGHWYPHHKTEISFLKILFNQLKGTVLAMQEIRKVNPDAKLIQTEDLAKVFSTQQMKYQADFENIRRWLTYDILTGKLTSNHPLYYYIIESGINVTDINFFQENPCMPDILGANYYVTSERYLDENVHKYFDDKDEKIDSGEYVDVEAVRIYSNEKTGLKLRLNELWLRYRIPVAVTELHMNCHREEQLRWFHDAWNDCKELKNEGVDIKGLTAWALLGSYGWDKLLTDKNHKYETGVFDITSGKLRETCITRLLRKLSQGQSYEHPLLETPGWWKRNSRFINTNFSDTDICNSDKLIFIISKRGVLGSMFAKHCDDRAINYLPLGRNDFDICDTEQMNNMIRLYKPWAIINCAGYVNIDLAETEITNCLNLNTRGIIKLADICQKNNIKLVTFSSDMVFNGEKGNYSEEDQTDPVNIYGMSKVLAENFVMLHNPNALIIRTSSFFSPYDQHNFLSIALDEISEGRKFTAEDGITISPTYVPHLVDKTLDLLTDDENGVVHLTNKGSISWYEFACTAAKQAGLKTEYISKLDSNLKNKKVRRPANSSMTSIKGDFMPTLEEAISDYLRMYLPTMAYNKEILENKY
ncbi:MAG: sugar nucleotide-binding protein [Ignavibacteria bacterium]|nr:sugar nucleotide-binding protein [Ignavibacteria bacterium]